MNAEISLKAILILSDGIRGHLNQSRGVAHWLSRLTGAEILESEVPLLTGAAKARAKTAARACGRNAARCAGLARGSRRRRPHTPRRTVVCGTQYTGGLGDRTDNIGRQHARSL